MPETTVLSSQKAGNLPSIGSAIESVYAIPNCDESLKEVNVFPFYFWPWNWGKEYPGIEEQPADKAPQESIPETQSFETPKSDVIVVGLLVLFAYFLSRSI